MSRGRQVYASEKYTHKTRTPELARKYLIQKRGYMVRRRAAIQANPVLAAMWRLRRTTAQGLWRARLRAKAQALFCGEGTADHGPPSAETLARFDRTWTAVFAKDPYA